MKQKLFDVIRSVKPEYESMDFNENFVGFFDSFDMIMLVTELDKRFNISIQGVDIIPENFETPKSIAKLLSKYGVEIDI